MHATPKPLKILDPATGITWSVPARPITRLNADVTERWFVNVGLPAQRFRELVPAPFLAPDLRHGRFVLSLCRIAMRHGAPDWARLAMGPASDNCALRVGCRDLRDGSPAVWVGTRLTTHVLGRVLRILGFPPIEPDLEVRRSDASGLELRSRDGSLACSAAPGGRVAPRLFSDGAELTSWVTAGVRSYAATASPDRYQVVDLEKGSPNVFEILPGWMAQLTTPWGSWPADGVYRTCNGLYQWRVLGTVDREGHAAGSPQLAEAAHG